MHFVAAHESASGTKRTSLVALRMSAIGGKADMPCYGANARFDPKRTFIKPKNHRGILMQPHVRWSFPRIGLPAHTHWGIKQRFIELGTASAGSIDTCMEIEI